MKHLLDEMRVILEQAAGEAVEVLHEASYPPELSWREQDQKWKLYFFPRQVDRLWYIYLENIDSSLRYRYTTWAEPITDYKDKIPEHVDLLMTMFDWVKKRGLKGIDFPGHRWAKSADSKIPLGIG
jgi:hypothetical protein